MHACPPLRLIRPAATTPVSAGFVDVHTHNRVHATALRIVNSDRQSFAYDVDAEPRMSLGLHPWHAGDDDSDTQLDWVARHAAHPKVLAVGECGLDRLRGAALPIQRQCLLRQIALAERLRKPLIVHCVRAFDELMRIKRDYAVSVPMIVHGFNKRGRVAAQLLSQGFWLSFGAALLDPRSAAARVLLEVADDHLLLETDASAVDIAAIYCAAAKIRGTAVTHLQEQMLRNFRTLFGND